MRYPRPLSIVLAGALALGVAGVPMVTSAQAAQRTATAVRTVTDGVTTFAVVDNPGGPTLSYIPGSGITLLTESSAAGTLTFKDFDADGQLDAFEDWRKPVNERAKALAAVLSIEQIAGLMLFSSHERNLAAGLTTAQRTLSLIHISEPTRPY